MTRPANGKKGKPEGLAKYYEEGLEGDRYCRKCQMIIFAGNPMYSKVCNSGVSYYHKSCYEKMFY